MSAVVLAIAVTACGGSSSSSSAGASTKTAQSPRTSTTAGPASASPWRAATDQLCQAKLGALVRLGYVDITYAGIAREGLPKIKRLLLAYFARMLALERHFGALQLQIPVPGSIRFDAVRADRIEASEEASITRLQVQLGSVSSAAELSAAFNGWLGGGRALAVQGNALAHTLGLGACVTGLGRSAGLSVRVLPI
jgi:uncharacterized protein YidB (DUF937 family)